MSILSNTLAVAVVEVVVLVLVVGGGGLGQGRGRGRGSTGQLISLATEYQAQTKRSGSAAFNYEIMFHPVWGGGIRV